MHDSSVLCITEEDNLLLNAQYLNHVHNNNTHVFRTFPDTCTIREYSYKIMFHQLSLSCVSFAFIHAVLI